MPTLASRKDERLIRLLASRNLLDAPVVDKKISIRGTPVYGCAIAPTRAKADGVR